MFHVRSWLGGKRAACSQCQQFRRNWHSSVPINFFLFVTCCHASYTREEMTVKKKKGALVALGPLQTSPRLNKWIQLVLHRQLQGRESLDQHPQQCVYSVSREYQLSTSAPFEPFKGTSELGELLSHTVCAGHYRSQCLVKLPLHCRLGGRFRLWRGWFLCFC